ncbi:MAG: thiol reductant ABC exporter subunit CydC [Azospirillaceae bacterium]
MRDLVRILALFGDHKAWLAGGAVLALTTVVMGLGLMTTAGWLVASAATAGAAAAIGVAGLAIAPGLAIRFFAVGRVLSRYAERLVTHDATFRVLARLRVWFFDKAIPLAPARLGTWRSGDLLNRLTADIDALDTVYLKVLTPSVVAIVAVAGLGVLLALFSGAVAAATVAVLVVAGLLLPLAAYRLAAPSGEEQVRATAGLRTAVVDTIQGLAELLAFGAAGRQRAEVDRASERLIAHQRADRRVSGMTIAASGLAGQLALWVALWVAVAEVHAGTLAAPVLALVALAVVAGYEAIAPLPAAYQALGRSIAAARRVLAVADAEPAVVDPPAPAAPPAGNDLRISGLSFSYAPDGPRVLDGLDLDLTAGRKVALLGPSGAGKSTVAQVLLRLWPYETGSITLGGVELGDLAQAEARARFGYLSQRTEIFAGTLRENLLLGDPEADDAALMRALDAARLGALMAELPDGLDTWVGESGVRLSGGQARRLALARVYLKDAPILVLDEPTEGLDRETEAELWSALDTLVAGRAALVVTHRPGGLEGMDEIVVLEAGRVVERGTPDALDTAGGRYTDLKARWSETP